jgi:hypothetical protein
VENILPDGVPLQVKESAVWLKDKVGVNEWAFPYNEARILLNYLSENGNMILGGDVLKADSNSLSYNFDNWYYNQDKSKSKEENIKNSYLKAIMYLDTYNKKNGNSYLYVIVFKSIK